jgi:predicted acetyltransferase
MAEIRFAKNNEINKLKELWKLCFGDEESYIDFYYKYRFKQSETLLLFENNQIASMLTMMPLELVLQNNRIYKTTMLYAIATHPNYRGKNLATQLITQSNKYIKSNNECLSVLVPASQPLFAFYYNQNYKDGFYIRENLLSYKSIQLLSSEILEKCNLAPASADKYNYVRNKILSGKIFIKYSDEDVAYQKKLCQETNADIYILNFECAQGCVIIEKLSPKKIFIKELLLDDKYLNAALKQISIFFHAEKYMLRTPSFSGLNLGGSIRSFAVFKTLTFLPIDFSIDQSAYLGLAFD